MILMDALSLQKTKRRPVWIMRQAGRYLASFRKIRQKHGFLEVCDSAALSLEVSLLPVKQYELDASIVFSDILLPLRAHGLKVEFTDEGPLVYAPKSEAELSKLRPSFDPHEGTPTILETLKLLRAEISKEKAVLGFAGAPFTLLVYLLEGKLSKDFSVVKKWMFEKPEIVHLWLDRLASSTGKYLEAQVDAGANAVQLFDTWASCLGQKSYEEFALPYARKALSQVSAPSIYYVNGISGILESAASVGAQCLSIDWRMSLGEARKRTSQITALQGNLDPHELLLPKAELRQRVFRMLDSYGSGPGHIANLGHGIVPGIPEDAVKVFIDSVHEWGQK